MTRAIAITYTATKDNMSTISAIILGLCLCMGVVYGLSIFNTISKTVSLQKAEVQVASMTSAVASLDAQYLSLSRSVTPDKLTTYGLSQGRVSTFIPRNSSMPRVAMANPNL